MGDMGDDFRAFRDANRQKRAAIGVDCPGCKVARPKANPTRLMPGKTCKVCGTTYTEACQQERVGE